MQPLVSLILLSYNRETFLEEAIASVLAQTYQNFELVIWDDGSSDRSLAIAQAAAQRDPRVRVVAGERCGKIPTVRVQAIAQTSGKYLGWLDSDDHLTPTTLERTVAILEARPAVGMVYTDHMVMNVEGQLEEYGQRCRIPYSRDRLLVDFITFHFRLLRRNVYEQIGGIDPSCEYAYDYDLCLRLSEVTEVHHLPLPLYHYRRHMAHQSQQHRIEQIWGSRDAINRALVRRGMSDRVRLNVQLYQDTDRPGAVFQLVACKPPRTVCKPLQWASAFLAAMPLAGTLTAPLLAQPVAPANDGTGTVVNQNGNEYDITGGRRSQDNLFHSLERLGLSRDEIANFQTDANIRNILTRVVGGDPSVIDGLLRVSGSDANLFILNPAGVLFGRNARLDLGGSFTASTATGLGFDNGWFNVNGTPNYSALTGNPTNFAFATLSPGVVLNAGNLEVGAGQSLTLLGGTVVNTGRVAAPGGTITLAAVPGQNRVRLSQEGSLLNLEFAPLQRNTPGVSGLSFTPLSLPELLTGGSVNVATGIRAQADGTVRLVGSQTVIPTDPGTAIVSGRVVAASNQAGATPEINVVGDRVALVDARLDARSQTGGSTVRVGGDYHGGTSLPTATVTAVDAESTIDASATQNGNGGNVVLWSDGLTAFQGTIQARGRNGNGGFVEVSGAQDLVFQGQVDVTVTNGTIGTLLLDPTDILISNDPSSPATVDAALPSIFAGDFPGQSVTINATTLQNQLATIVLEATNDIRVADGLSLNFTRSANGIFFRADSDSSGAGGFFMDPTQSILTNGRNLTITGATIVAGTLDTSIPIFSGSFAEDGTAGNLRLRATGDITTDRIIATGGGYGGEGGQVSLVSPRGDISVRSIDVEGFSGFSEAIRDGGQVLVNSDLFRVTDTVNVESEVSIQASRGTVNIIHRGGPRNIPFRVGQGAGLLNGTAGTIVAGTGDDLTFGTYPVLENGGDATLPATVNGVTIRSVNNAPILIGLRNQTFSTTVDQSITIRPQDLLFESDDVNGDRTVTRYEVASLPAGASLTANGELVQTGDTFDASAELVFTPPPGFTGTLEGFSLRVSDLDRGQPVLATSEPFTVSFRINPNPVIPPPDPVTPPPDPIDEPTDPELPEPPELYVEDPPRITTDPFVPPGSGGSTVIDCCMNAIERQYNREFTDYLGLAPVQTATVEQAETIAQDIEQATGARPAFIYISFVPPESNLRDDVPVPQDTDQLELVIVTAEGGLVRYRVPDATRSRLMEVARTFRNDITNPINISNTRYRASGQQLYEWIISPLLADLRRLEITNLVFLPEAGLRSLPYSALYDGQQFLIEQFSVGLMPSISLTDTRYVDIRNSSMLAMGIAESTQGQTPLPAVPLEVDTLALQVWGGKVFLNDDSTIQNLQIAREQQPFGIIHLATHADFVAGDAGESYIQLWNERLRMDEVRQLGWNNPPVELLVLSACRTALGNEQAELGFAGLAIQSGVKSAVASLWYVSDAATAALMARFYEGLQVEPIKAEALRQAQMAMARGEVSVDENGQLVGLGKIRSLRLPPESARAVLGQTLSHPYYWAAFTLIGNPW